MYWIILTTVLSLHTELHLLEIIVVILEIKGVLCLCTLKQN